MKGNNWWLIVILGLAAWLIYRTVKERSLGTRSNNMIPIGNPTTIGIAQPPVLALQSPTNTRIFAERIVVPTAGTPVRLPAGKPVSDVRLSTVGNTGTIYLGTSFVECRDAKHRFAVATANNISLPFRVSDLSDLWLDAATANDGVSILCEVESN